MLERAKIVAVLSLLAVSAVSVASAGPYKSKYISDIKTYTAFDHELMLKDRRMDLSISYEEEIPGGRSFDLERSHSEEYIKRNIRDSLMMISNFNTSNGVRTKDCRSDYNLNIFIVSEDTMFNTDRFDEFLRSRGMNASKTIVYGFYDPTVLIKSNSNIILSNVSSHQNYLSIQHELAHWWWDRLCLANLYSGDSEDYAVAYEQYAKIRYDKL